MIRVLLADDHPVVREGLRGMLAAEQDIAVVAEAASGAEAVAMAATHRPDVVLMDLRMPHGDGVEATAAILDATPGARIVVLTTYETDADIMRAVEAGAVGYLLKDTPTAALGNAIRAAARGRPCSRRRLRGAWSPTSANHGVTSCPAGRPRCSHWSPAATPTQRSAASCSSARPP